MTGVLAGRVVVVVEGVDARALVRRLVAEGASVVVTGSGGRDAGGMLADLEGGPGRVAFFGAEAGAEALVEFLAEQFGEGGRP